jgi:hypothetical protein
MVYIGLYRPLVDLHIFNTLKLKYNLVILVICRKETPWKRKEMW